MNKNCWCNSFYHKIKMKIHEMSGSRLNEKSLENLMCVILLLTKNKIAWH